MTSPAGNTESPIHHSDIPSVTVATATRVGGRTANADAGRVHVTPLGVGAAVVDGIGSSPAVVAAAHRAADTAAVVASHRGAQAGMMAAADTMPHYPGCPNAVAAVASIDPTGRIEIAHVGDCAVWTWSPSAGLTRWTVDHAAGQHVAHMLDNPSLTAAARTALAQHGDHVVSVLGDYVLTSLAYATISTISWTPLRGEAADVALVVVTSDGVHKAICANQITAVVEAHAHDAQTLADALVDTAVATPRRSADETADNATAAVLRLHRAR